MNCVRFFFLYFSTSIPTNFDQSVGRIKTQGICGTSPFKCCNNYYRKDNLCLECPSGRYGDYCSKTCPINFYGRLCLESCNCTSNEACDAEKGCTDYDSNIKNISFQLSLMFSGVVFAVIAVIWLSYVFARKLLYYQRSVQDITGTGIVKRTADQGNAEVQPRNDRNSDFGTLYSSATTDPYGKLLLKSNVYGYSEFKKAESDTLPQYTMTGLEYCDVSHNSERSSSDREFSDNQNLPPSRTHSETNLLYLRPLDLISASSPDARYSSSYFISPSASERDTYVEVHLNFADFEKSFIDQAEIRQERIIQQTPENKKELISDDYVYGLPFPAADQIKGTVAPNAKQLFLTDLSNQILKMKRK